MTGCGTESLTHTLRPVAVRFCLPLLSIVLFYFISHPSTRNLLSIVVSQEEAHQQKENISLNRGLRKRRRKEILLLNSIENEEMKELENW